MTKSGFVLRTAAALLIAAAPASARSVIGGVAPAVGDRGSVPATAEDRDQGEAALKAFFEGRAVVVHLTMPATAKGVDVYPVRQPPIDYSVYYRRLRDSGVALGAGETSVITRIKVKDDLIEFQLGGGGYGTFWEQTNPLVVIPPAPPSPRECAIAERLKEEKSDRARKRLVGELEELRARRLREDARNQMIAAELTELNRLRIQRAAALGGSRFNIRFEEGVPLEALTPGAILDALAGFVDLADPVLVSAEPGQ